ncbi:hypothetical protein LTR15_003732 [Elasticomyces elasticus]|nr:hypothetical protein LTR15_003732 [Elasticomyces elasticus]
MCIMLQSLILTLALLLCRCLAVDDDPHPTLPGPRTPVPSLYDQRYSEQTFIGTHDSVAVRTAENRWSLSGNQYFNVSVQLQAGVRLLQAQGHRDPNGSSEIRLCHFNCALMDGGSLVDHLRIVKRFLDANPHEVVTLLFVNTGPALEYWAQAYLSTGLDLLSYIPPPSKRDGYMHLDDWPTIADMAEQMRAGFRIYFINGTTFLRQTLASRAQSNTAVLLHDHVGWIRPTSRLG